MFHNWSNISSNNTTSWRYLWKRIKLKNSCDAWKNWLTHLNRCISNVMLSWWKTLILRIKYWKLALTQQFFLEIRKCIPSISIIITGHLKKYEKRYLSLTWSDLKFSYFEQKYIARSSGSFVDLKNLYDYNGLLHIKQFCPV